MRQKLWHKTPIPIPEKTISKPKSRKRSRIFASRHLNLSLLQSSWTHSAVRKTIHPLVAAYWSCEVIFFKTRPPVEPVNFVEKICLDAAAGVQQNNCRYVKRLTPISAFDKATTKGLDAVAKTVLAPHFHQPDQASKKVSLKGSEVNAPLKTDNSSPCYLC